MESNSKPSNLDQENARLEMIDKIVKNSSSQNTPNNKDAYYRSQLPKVKNFNLEDCIEAALTKDSKDVESEKKDIPVLRTFETLDLDALTKGFEPEEIKEGKLVLYITEKQLLQLLKQRAIVVPNKSTLTDISNKNYSLVDEKVGARLGRKTPIREVELVVNQDQDKFNRPVNPLSKLSDKDSSRSSQKQSTNIHVSTSPTQGTYGYDHSSEYLENRSDSKVIENSVYKSTKLSESNIFEESYQHIRTETTSGNYTNDRPSSQPGKNDDYGSIYLTDKNYDSLQPSSQTGRNDAYGSIYLTDKNYDSLQPSSQTGRNDAYGSIYLSDKNYDSQQPSSRKISDAFLNSTTTYHQDNMKDISLSNIRPSDVQALDKKYESLLTGEGRAMSGFGRSSLTRISESTKDSQVAIQELEKFSNRLTTSIKDDKIDWTTVQNIYSNPSEQTGVDIIKNYVHQLADDQRTIQTILPNSNNQVENKQNTDSNKVLNLLDNFINRVTNSHKESGNIDRQYTDKEALDLLNNLVSELRTNIVNKSSEQYKTGHKIIIKTTRKLPPKLISTNVTNVANCKNYLGLNSSSKNLFKKKTQYSYLDDKYKTSTRFYELGTYLNADNNKTNVNSTNLFNLNNNTNYSIKTFDPLVTDNIAKPSVEQINKYLSVVNTGLKNANLVQIHPLTNNQSELKTKIGTDSSTSIPVIKEPVIIDPTNPKYLEDISKYFGGLQVTDFPLYVQGVDFRKTSKTHSNAQPKSTASKQTFSNSSNTQYLKVNNSAQPVAVATN